MSFLSNLKSALPFVKKEEVLEYFFALNIASENLTAALWIIEGKELKILETAFQSYSSLDDLIFVTDKLLDEVLGIREIEPQKILFGVPSLWLRDENLKEEYLIRLRKLVKELELTPMAYVEAAHALTHFLEKQEGVPATAILVGFEQHHLTVTVVRAGKIDGVKFVSRTDSSGADIEKALLNFTQVETLPSKIFIYGAQADLKSRLLSFTWMSKLSFLHFPKIDNLQDQIEIKSVCLAGATEIEGNILYTERPVKQAAKKGTTLSLEEDLADQKDDQATRSLPDEEDSKNLGFVVGDVSDKLDEETNLIQIDDSGYELPAPVSNEAKRVQAKSLTKGIHQKKSLGIIILILTIPLVIFTAYLFILKADVKVFVEPRVLEKDAQVTADPNQKQVDEDAKVIPGQIVSVEVSGLAKAAASGTKQIGDPAKGTIVIYNKISSAQSLSKGTQITGPGSLKFTLDTSMTIASQSATDSGIAFGKANTTVTAVAVGADGNLPSGAQFSVGGYSSDNLLAKSEGNFSGGNSKDVTVVSLDDQQKLLASLASDLRKQAQQKLQGQLPQKKILTEGLNEEIVKKSFSKNVNDQAAEFSLNLTARYKGTAFDDH